MALALGAGQFCCCGYSVGKCKQLPVTGNKHRNKLFKGCWEDLPLSAVSTHPQTFGCCGFFGKIKPRVQKKKKDARSHQRITIEYIKVIIVSSWRGSHPFPAISSCVGSPGQLHAWMIPLGYGSRTWGAAERWNWHPAWLCLCSFTCINHFMSPSFCFKSPPKRHQERPSLQGFGKGLEELQIHSCPKICCHYCNGHHPPGTTAPTHSASRAHRLCCCCCSSW